MSENIRTIEFEARSLGAAKGRANLVGNIEEAQRIERRLAVLRVRKAILTEFDGLGLTAEDVAEVVATVKSVAA